jgi:hypothetical protein
MRCQQCEETATNSSAMAGLLVSQPNQNTKSQTLSPHEDHYPGKIRIKIPARKPLKRQKKKKQKPEKERINLKNQNHKIEKKRKDDRAEGKPKEESGIPASSQNSSNEHQQGLRPERQHQISRHCFPLIYI